MSRSNLSRQVNHIVDQNRKIEELKKQKLEILDLLKEINDVVFLTQHNELHTKIGEMLYKFKEQEN